MHYSNVQLTYLLEGWKILFLISHLRLSKETLK